MTESRITQADLDWWLEFAATREWTFAKTYAETAPHHYVVAGPHPGRDPRRHGARRARDPHLRVAGQVLLADQDLSRQPRRAVPLVDRGQALHRRHAGQPRDDRAVLRHPERAVDGQRHRDAVRRGRDHLGRRAPDRAAAGPTTSSSCSPAHAGSTRRTSSTSAAAPAASSTCGWSPPNATPVVDSSRAMLNMLIRKHPRVAAVYPIDVRDALAAGLFTRGQFDWVFLDGSGRARCRAARPGRADRSPRCYHRHR